MCGLTGFLHSGKMADPGAVVAAMNAQIVHRGPDAGDIWLGEGIALGHRRLSILDLSAAGAQPMQSAEGRYVIVYNGEIYNHFDLRAQLAADGADPVWCGHSDTETLLAGIAFWGLEEALRRAHGMFSLALWDRRDRRLSLARDRMGEKPLYWGWAGTSIVFGSELKALRSHPEFSVRVCREALDQYLSFAYVPAPRSIYSSIYKLEPGTILTVGAIHPASPPTQPLRPGSAHGSISIARFWSLEELVSRGARNRHATEAEALEHLQRALGRAVGRQLISDVPLGAFLSGGVDSSLIVALMQAQSARSIRTFTVGFENAAYTEAPYAAEVARHIGTDHTELIVTDKEAREVIPHLPTMYDEPFADSSQIPTYLVCKAARSEVTVALSGDAGDELFGGYTRYLWGPRVWSALRCVPHPLRKGIGHLLAALPPHGWDNLGRATGGRFSHPGDKAHRLATMLRDVRTIDDLYRGLVTIWPDEDMVRGLVGRATSTLDDPFPPDLEPNPASSMMLQDMRSYLPGDILTKVDRAAMAVSLETRVPFLDPEVLEASARLPVHMKLRQGEGKWALRQILYEHVPRELIERPKIGFGIPVGDWLRGPLRSWAEDLLTEEVLRHDGLLDPAPVRQAWAEHLSGRREWSQKLWTVLMLMSWRASVS